MKLCPTKRINPTARVWDRWYWHRNDLHQCIADFASFRKPDLTVMDAYNVMKRNGSGGCLSTTSYP
ncbi:MAG: DUF362 domain-containing protein [Desulfobacterium sp.]|nr:DUF362 domain-containing protein [Desulfobacterium sp.]